MQAIHQHALAGGGGGPPERGLELLGGPHGIRGQRAEIELAMQPNNNFDFAVSMGFNDSQLRSTIESTAADGTVSVVSGIREGNRLPSVPQFQAAAAATYQWQMSGGLAYVTGTYQHIGSRYTQVGDEEPGFGTISLLSFAPNTIGGPLTQGSFTFDPLLPAYDLFNLRLGLLRGQWDFSLYANNLFDEQALTQGKGIVHHVAERPDDDVAAAPQFLGASQR